MLTNHYAAKHYGILRRSGRLPGKPAPKPPTKPPEPPTKPTRRIILED